MTKHWLKLQLEVGAFFDVDDDYPLIDLVTSIHDDTIKVTVLDDFERYSRKMAYSCLSRGHQR